MILKKIYNSFKRRFEALFNVILNRFDKIDNDLLRKIITVYERLNLIPDIKTNKEEIIVSLTTYGDRFSEVHYTLFSLFRQSYKPNKIILWLDEKEFTYDNVINNKILSKYIKKGLTISFCTNYRSYNKFIPTLESYPDSTIIVCDDDAYYNKKWLEILINEHKNNPNDILCHAATKIGIKNNTILPYKDWETQHISTSGYNLIPLGVSGALFTKSFFYQDILNKKFIELAPSADDLWLWVQAVLNNTKIKIVEDFLYYPKDLGADRTYTKLFTTNVVYGNDNSIINLINEYPQIMKLIYS